MQCHNYKTFRHVKAECWFKEEEADVAKENEVSHLFMAHSELEEASGNVWLVDNGCSNHMSGLKELFQ